jgi:hypothetical protein
VYQLLIFVHVFSVVALLGPTYLGPALAKLRGNPPSPAILRVEAVMCRYAAAFYVVAFLTGAGLITLSPATKDGGFVHARWLHLGIGLWFVAAGVVTGYITPRVGKALAAAEQGDGAEARRLMAPVDTVAGPVAGVLAAVIVYLMLAKPSI